MLFKSRHQARNFAVGLFVTATDLDEADDLIHDREDAVLTKTKREAAQKRDLRRETRKPVQSKVHLRTSFSRDEIAEEQDLMAFLYGR